MHLPACRRRTATSIAGALAFAALPVAAPAQHVHDASDASSMGTRTLRIGAHAVPLLTHVSPIMQGRALTEAYLTQPSVFGEASLWRGALRAVGTLSLEALTLERGELGAGTYGEGYVDRRHPHTYAHELMLTASGDVGPAAASLSAGRGFAPFGTDDPMMRPFVKFPVNHHLAQVLERVVVIGAIRAGPIVAEVSTFTGTEPFSATDIGSFDRFADSWSARVTVLPVAGLEVQASHAWVVSPEMPRGEGTDQRKWSASARYARGGAYALVEWNRTMIVDDGQDTFDFGGALIEAALDWRGWRPGIRIERTERPEEARGFDPFRSPFPHAGSHLLGMTQWTTGALRVERAGEWRGIGAAPFIEVSLARVAETSGSGLFNPTHFYGSTRIATLNVGARFRAGLHPSRMGRYGVAVPTAVMHEQGS